MVFFQIFTIFVAILGVLLISKPAAIFGGSVEEVSSKGEKYDSTNALVELMELELEIPTVSGVEF